MTSSLFHPRELYITTTYKEKATSHYSFKVEEVDYYMNLHYLTKFFPLEKSISDAGQ